ncbi:MAG: Cytochrome peroxidase [Labilithrix sp.]|nr:Cytochrome peroxidase [Labilithrix sp.]
MPALVSSSLFGACAAAVVLAAGCDNKKSEADHTSAAPVSSPTEPAAPTPAAEAPKRAIDPNQLLVFAALPAKVERADNPVTDEKVALGRQLFFDARLSKGQDVSCNTCHDVSKSGAESQATSIGTKKTKNPRNAPTVFNVAGASAQGWDARSPLLEDFVLPHVATPTIMDADDKRIEATLGSIPGYAAAFKKAFPEDKTPTAAAASKAVAAYVRRLLTPSAWDKFLGGDQAALSEDQKAGLGAFLDANCMTCHAGKYLGAAQNQKLGVAKPWPSTSDLGRFAVTKEEVDRFVFKVPTLRNVTKTGPYLHDGSIDSLEETVKLMERHQVGKDLTDAQARSIVTFLGALEGDAPKDLVKKPDLPASGPKTPKPE